MEKATINPFCYLSGALPQVEATQTPVCVGDCCKVHAGKRRAAHFNKEMHAGDSLRDGCDMLRMSPPVCSQSTTRQKRSAVQN